MAKSKLITIPIEEEKRERLNKYCSDKGSTVSQTLTKYIDLLLDGSIDDDTQLDNRPGPIDLPYIIQRIMLEVKPLIIDEAYTPYMGINSTLRKHQDSIDELKNKFSEIESLFNDLNDRLISNPQLQPLPDVDIESIKVETPPKQPAEATTPNDTYLPTEKTLDDTKAYITDQLQHNKQFKKRSDRITNQQIADSLQDNGFPHPEGRVWHRNHIPQVAKLLEIESE
jgi:hypothetical protein